MELLNLEDVLTLHASLIAESGGSSGVRDMGAVESAVAQPQVAFGGQELYPRSPKKRRRCRFRW
ncbi:MAG TPA: hypothetical protein VF600_11155 [Abditibacteriaceae bacterium]|jgi:death-on-curing protein